MSGKFIQALLTSFPKTTSKVVASLGHLKGIKYGNIQVGKETYMVNSEKLKSLFENAELQLRDTFVKSTEIMEEADYIKPEGLRRFASIIKESLGIEYKGAFPSGLLDLFIHKNTKNIMIGLPRDGGIWLEPSVSPLWSEVVGIIK